MTRALVIEHAGTDTEMPVQQCEELAPSRPPARPATGRQAGGADTDCGPGQLAPRHPHRQAETRSPSPFVAHGEESADVE